MCNFCIKMIRFPGTSFQHLACIIDCVLPRVCLGGQGTVSTFDQTLALYFQRESYVLWVCPLCELMHCHTSLILISHIITAFSSFSSSHQAVTGFTSPPHAPARICMRRRDNLTVLHILLHVFLDIDGTR